MEPLPTSPPEEELVLCVQRRTSWRVRDLVIELLPERAVLRGRATTAFTRRLAQHAVQDFLPHLSLENIIVVDHPEEVILGIPLN